MENCVELYCDIVYHVLLDRDSVSILFYTGYLHRLANFQPDS